MKRLLILLLAVCLASCGGTEAERKKSLISITEAARLVMVLRNEAGKPSSPPASAVDYQHQLSELDRFKEKARSLGISEADVESAESAGKDAYYKKVFSDAGIQ